MPERFIPVATLSELAEGTAVARVVGDLEIALCNIGNVIFAVENLCSHDDGDMDGASVEGCAIECPRHGARFDLRTGEPLRMPAVAPIRTFETRVEGETVFVKVDDHE